MTTDNMIDDFDFSASEGAEVAKDSSKGGDFQREIEFLSLKGDQASINQNANRAILRLVTERVRKDWMTTTTPWTLPWITVKQHYASTKAKPPYAKESQNWPQKMYAVCRKDKVFSAKFHDQCYLDEVGNKPSSRTWALAIEREQIFEGGQVVGIRDKTREVFDHDAEGNAIVLSTDGDKKTYKMKTVPAWVVLNFGWKNFFGHLDGQGQYFNGSVLGRDFVVQRSGEGPSDTTYSFFALEPQTITGDFASALGVQDGSPYDMGLIVGDDNGRPITLMEALYPDMPDLRRIIAERTSESYFGRWFIPGWTPEGFDPSAQQGGGAPQNGVQQGYQPTGGVQTQPQQPQAPQTPQPQQQASSGPNSDALAALRNRVQGNNNNS